MKRLKISNLISTSLSSSISNSGLRFINLLSACTLYSKSSGHIQKYVKNERTLMQTIGNIAYDILEFLTINTIASLIGAATSLAVSTIPVIGMILPAIAIIAAGYGIYKAAEFIKLVVGKFTKKVIELYQAGAIIASGGVFF